MKQIRNPKEKRYTDMKNSRILRALSLVLACLTVMSCLPCTLAAETEETKLIALTFDDGPSAYTDTLLDTLAEYGAHATFFVSGYRLSDYSSQLERIAQEGHQLGNHTQNHKNLTKLSADALDSEILQTLDTLKAVGGNTKYAVRPVGGAYNSRVCAAARAPLFNWSVDTLDWKYRSTNSVYKKIMTARDGDIVLMHDLYKTTVEAACKAIPELIENGYELVTINELFRRKGITLQDGTLYVSASAATLPDVASEAYPAVARVSTAVIDAEAGSDGVYSASVTVQSLPVTISTPCAGVTLTFSDEADFSGTLTVRVWKEDGAVCVDLVQNGQRLETAPCRVTVGLQGTNLLPGSVAAEVADDGTRTTVMSSAAVSPSAMRVRVDGSTRLALVQDESTAFRDADYDWVKNAADFVSARGIIGGVSTDMFGPYTGMTRGMMATVLWRMAGSPEPAAPCSFTDVDASMYYADAIAWGSEQGIISGVGNNRFAPDSQLTREQTVQLLYKLLGSKTEGSYPGSASAWAHDAYAWGCESGVVTKDTAAWLRPSGAISRAEVAVLLHRAVTESVWN